MLVARVQAIGDTYRTVVTDNLADALRILTTKAPVVFVGGTLLTWGLILLEVRVVLSHPFLRLEMKAGSVPSEDTRLLVFLRATLGWEPLIVEPS